jgi:hypothetical protein
MDNNNYSIKNGKENINRDYPDYNHNESVCESDTAGGKPAERHYIMYLIRKVWADRRLRLLLIVSFVVFKVILTITVVFIIPQIAR